MTELEVLAATGGGLAFLSLAVFTVAAARGWVEVVFSVRVIVPWKRCVPEPRTPAKKAEKPEGAAASPNGKVTAETT